MSIFDRGIRLGTLLIALAGLAIAPLAFADDMDDVMAVIAEYGELEDNLQEQADLIRDDRVMITNVRQSDQKKNMAIQIAARKANEAANGGKTKFITTIEAPQIKLYGDVAVASFVRTFAVFPHNQAPVPANPGQWVTLVLVKEGGDWGIAHTHMSPNGNN